MCQIYSARLWLIALIVSSIYNKFNKTIKTLTSIHNKVEKSDRYSFWIAVEAKNKSIQHNFKNWLSHSKVKNWFAINLTLHSLWAEATIEKLGSNKLRSTPCTAFANTWKRHIVLQFIKVVITIIIMNIITIITWIVRQATLANSPGEVEGQETRPS